MISLFELPEGLIRPAWRDCPVPGRPWWEPRVEVVTRIAFPGVPATTEYSPEFVMRRDRARADDENAAAAYDAAHPLPHPGYRPGQIWAADVGEMACVLGPLTAWECENTGPGDAPLFHALSQHPACEWVSGETDWTALWAGHLRPRPRFLLHDPLRPDLAPWSDAAPMSGSDANPPPSAEG